MKKFTDPILVTRPFLPELAEFKVGITSRVLTLPTYYGLPLEEVKDIARNVLEIVQG